MLGFDSPIDCRVLIPGAQLHSVPTYDLCIVGAGLAGLSLATALLPSGLRIALLESGADDVGPGERPAVRPAGGRRSYAPQAAGPGGMGRHWGGQLIGIDSQLMQEPLSAWPVSAAELDRFLLPALSFLGLRGDALGTGVLALLAPAVTAGALQRRESLWLPFRQRNRAPAVRRLLRRQQRVDLITGVSAVGLEPASGGARLAGVRVRGAAGGGRIDARTVVVAAGAPDTLRLLLAAQADGALDQALPIGRKLQEHFRLPLLQLDDEQVPLARSLRARFQDRRRYQPRLELSADARQHHGCVAAHLHCEMSWPQDGVLLATRERLRRRQRGGTAAGASSRHTVLSAAELQFAAGLARSYLLDGDAPAVRGEQLMLWADIEHGPHNRSRMAVDGPSAPDRLPALRLHWDIGAPEQRAIEALAEALGEVGLPLGELPGIDGAQDLLHLSGGACMGEDPRRGVVNPQLRVFGCDNLYLASTAVLPRTGTANPTLTLLQLCQRLAEELGRQLASEARPPTRRPGVIS